MLTFLQYIAQRRFATLHPRACADPIINTKFFCSVIRDDDRTSREAKAFIVSRPDAAQLSRTFRYLNWVPSFVEVAPHLHSYADALACLSARQARGEKIFSTAYKICPPHGGIWSLPAVARMMTRLYNCPHPLASPSGRSTAQRLIDYEAGPFLAYQVMQDMRWATGPYNDEMTWAYFGPGALRGLARLTDTYGANKSVAQRAKEQDRNSSKSLAMPPGQTPMLLDLLEQARGIEPRMNMFELEHNLCEWDKFCRVATGESKGKPYVPREVLNESTLLSVPC